MKTTKAEISRDDRLRSRLIKSAAGSLILQIGFAGLSFINALILARVLGAGGYGTFANAMAWVSILTIPATFGFGILLVRDIAIYRSQNKWALLKGLLRFSNRFVIGLSVMLALIASAVAKLIFSKPEQAHLLIAIWIALPLVPLFALSNLKEAAMRGLEHIIHAFVPTMIIRPGLLLVSIILIYILWPQRFEVPIAMVANVGGGIIALGVGTIWLRQLLPLEIKQAEVESSPRIWLNAAFPMLVYGGAQIILNQTDIVMLGGIRSPEEVGLYAAAGRLAILLGYGMMAAEMIMAPVIARLYADGEKDRLQKIVTRAVRIALISVLPFGLVLIIWRENILAIFGHEFMLAQTALVILIVGRLLHVALGSGALLLSMAGEEKKVAHVLAAAVLGNVIGNAILIPLYGIDGAAIASTISLIIMRYVLSRYAVLRTELHVTAMGKPTWI